MPESRMKVGLLKLELFFPYCHSLKEKRHFLRKIKDKIFAKHKVLVHEVAHHDKWQRAQLGLALVGHEATLLSSLIDKIENQIIEYGLGEVIDSQSEIIDF